MRRQGAMARSGGGNLAKWPMHLMQPQHRLSIQRRRSTSRGAFDFRSDFNSAFTRRRHFFRFTGQPCRASQRGSWDWIQVRPRIAVSGFIGITLSPAATRAAIERSRARASLWPMYSKYASMRSFSAAKATGSASAGSDASSGIRTPVTLHTLGSIGGEEPSGVQLSRPIKSRAEAEREPKSGLASRESCARLRRRVAMVEKRRDYRQLRGAVNAVSPSTESFTAPSLNGGV